MSEQLLYGPERSALNLASEGKFLPGKIVRDEENIINKSDIKESIITKEDIIKTLNITDDTIDKRIIEGLMTLSLVSNLSIDYISKVTADYIHLRKIFYGEN